MATDRQEESGTDDVLADLQERVLWIEEYFGLPALAHRKQAQEERDKDLLARTPNSYEEAQAQEAARKRQAERDKDSDQPEAEESSKVPVDTSKTPPAKQPTKRG